MRHQTFTQSYEHTPHRRALYSRVFSRQVEELRRMGVQEAEILNVLDEYSGEQLMRIMKSDLKAPGQEHPEAQTRARVQAPPTLDAYLAALSELRRSLRGQSVLVAGHFPPRLLGKLVASGGLTHLDAPDSFGFAPVHFYHLKPYGLRGVTRLSDITGMQFDVVIAYGAKVNSRIYVPAVVPVALRLFPRARRRVLESDYRLPEMALPVPAEGFDFIPRFLS